MGDPVIVTSSFVLVIVLVLGKFAQPDFEKIKECGNENFLSLDHTP